MNKRTKADWEALAMEYNASGRQQDEWCKEKGINVYTFRDRLSKMRKEAARSASKPIKRQTDKAPENPEEIQWIELTQMMAATEQPVTGVTQTNVARKCLEITIGDFRMNVTLDTEDALLVKACKALKSLC